VSSKKEIRFVTKELRAEGSSSKRTLRGYAAVFNSPSQDLGGFVEVIRQGAFARCLSQHDLDVRALVDHDASKILGRTKAGTLRLTEDSVGLRCEIDLPNTTLANDTYESVKRGDISQMSFGFYAVSENWLVNPSGQPAALRELDDVDVFDVSVVTFPAYEGTSIAARSLRSLWPNGQPEWFAQNASLKNIRRKAIESIADDAAIRMSMRLDILKQ
jgi:HK97 family phage prohead protease